jgi:hypothetical protein
LINIWIAFRNPFKVNPFKAVRLWEKQLTQHKTVEFQISRYAFNWLELQIDLNCRGTDHAGPWIMVGALGWQLDIRMYDRRHWNNETNNWA